MEWSRYMQSPRFLEITRKYYFSSPDTYPLIRRYLGLTGEMKILDVGCGSGFFTRLLAEGLTGGRVVGLDRDERHIAAAREIAGEQGLEKKTGFLVGGAFELPFPDGCFDLVVSHTFFNVVKNSRAALGEMIRVVGDGGRVASLDNMTLGNQTWHRGYYEEIPWRQRLEELEKKAWQLYQAVYPINSVAVGVATSEIPHFFASGGLLNVRVYALGRVFSLSNAAMTPEEKEEFINAMYTDAVEKIQNYLGLPQAPAFFSPDEVKEYIGLLRQKRDHLLAAIGENLVWDWHGGANLLTVGDIVKNRVKDETNERSS